MRSERGRKLGVLSEPATVQLSYYLHSIVSYSPRSAPHRSNHILHFRDARWLLTSRNLATGLESSLLTAIKPLCGLLYSACYVSVPYKHSIDGHPVLPRMLISANIASFRVIRLCLPSSKASRLLILASVHY
jgi:hypothetical protein